MANANTKSFDLIKELDILKTIFYKSEHREHLLRKIKDISFINKENGIVFKAMRLACIKNEFSEFSIEHEYAILSKLKKLPFDIHSFLEEGDIRSFEDYKDLANKFNYQQISAKAKILSEKFNNSLKKGKKIKELKDIYSALGELFISDNEEDNIKTALSERMKELMCPKKKMAEKFILKTENKQLDSLLGGGLPIGALTGIGAFPGGGKTTQCINIARGIIGRIISEKSNSRIILFSFDMQKDEILNLVISVLFSVPIQHIIDNKSPLEEEYERDMKGFYNELREFMEDDVLYVITDRKYTNQYEFNSLIREVSKYSKIELVIVDYIQQMVPDCVLGAERASYIQESLKNLKNISNEFKFPVVMAVQLVKNTDRNIFPNGSHIAETGAIERDCSVIYFVCNVVNKNKNKREDDVVQAIVIKSRIGKVSSEPTNLYFKPGTPQLLDVNPY